MTASRIAELEAELAAARAEAARQAADTRLSEELQPEPGFDFFARPEPEPEPVPGLPAFMRQYPEPRPVAHPRQPAAHGTGGHPGLGAGLAN